ncbi:MAG TPA: DUF2259 domain-containing protein [bacterium]|nr:DUF2259 domain-containing protein [bacterium]
MRNICVSILLLSTALLHSGDIAIFQNLGFSPDAQHYMFAQYGVSEKSSSPYTELFVVKVSTNRFVPGGVRRFSGSKAVGPGNDGRSALFTILEDSLSLKKKWSIDHFLTGRLLYILLDGQDPKAELEFRDFETGAKYNVKLIQSSIDSKVETKSSFHLIVTVEKSGTTNRYTVGLPNYWRNGVINYRIKQILLGPNERSLIFVIEKEEQDGKGVNIRYMVETLSR